LLVRDERFLWGLDGVTQGSVALTVGDLNIRDAVARSNDQAEGGAKTHGSFSRLSLNLSRLSLINKDWSMTGSLKMQRALGRNLDGSERMGIAGPGGVMAYPSGELSGSDAELVRIEITRNLPALGQWQHQASVLVNWGQARETDLAAKRDLSDVAVGYVAKNSNGFLIKAYLAHRLTEAAQSEKASRNRLVLQGGWVF
jgi:hemolysin activation/secretion protein